MPSSSQTAGTPSIAAGRRPADVLLAEVTRGAFVESEHHGAVALVFDDGRSWTAGDAQQPVWTRSAIKPFQALPLVESGAAARLGLSDEELALCCASHDGTASHVATARQLLARGGLVEEQLGCGPHLPFDRAAALELARAGRRPERVHNNCSGKHAGFLLLAQSLGQSLAEYLDPQGLAQMRVRAAVAELVGLPPGSLDVATDGCGAPTLRMPLTALAAGFCRLMNPRGLGSVREAACIRLRTAIQNAPVQLAGEGRLGTLLVRSAPGRVVPKNGAEGVYAVGGLLPGAGDGAARAFGLAIKVRDGAERGYFPVVIALLEGLGLWDGARAPAALADFAETPVRNTNQLTVGCVRLALEIPRSW
ncbi:MAG: asparaginase [Planctomycetes bacterium]|nr:asparaginase [Planctomycetota bacterium]